MRVAVIGQPDFNLIDGSTIWMLNTLRMLASIPKCRPCLFMHLPLKNKALADLIPHNADVIDIERFRRVTNAPWTDLSPCGIVDALAIWESAMGSLDRIIVRGDPFIERLLLSERYAAKLTIYVADVLPVMGETRLRWIDIARNNRVPLIVQSENARRVLSSLWDYPDHLVNVVPPVVFAPPETPKTRSPNRLVYSGKIDSDYGIDWLMSLAKRGEFDIEILAGKVNVRDQTADFVARYEAFCQSLPPQTSIQTGLPHDRALERISRARFGYCLRDACYDGTLEVSTKVIEYCGLGVFPIVNDTAVNRGLLGGDYPFLVSTKTTDVVDQVGAFLRKPDDSRTRTAKAAIRRVSDDHAPERATRRLQLAVRCSLDRHLDDRSKPNDILIATHDRKFLRLWAEAARHTSALRLHWEEWPAAGANGPASDCSPEVETVFCEWCCENAIWHSNNKRPNTRLVIRLHRFEAFTDFPSRVDWSNVDKLIVTSEFFRKTMADEYGIDHAKIVVAPQFVDWSNLQRPKHPEAGFVVGMVGINPFGQKRLDRALDFMSELRRADPRFSLVVRSEMPWRVGWVWNDDPDAQAAYREAFQRVRSDPWLKGAVRFDPAGCDMAEWYRGIGTVLSSSDSEGCHTAILEGMASGSLPVVKDWPGAESLFPGYVHSNLLDAIPKVREFAVAPGLDARRAEISEAARVWDVDGFSDLILAA